VNKAVFGITAVVLIAIVIALSIPQQEQEPAERNLEVIIEDAASSKSPPSTPVEQLTEPIQQQVPAPGFEDVPEMIVELENTCDSSYPDLCITPWPPDLDCDQIQFSNFKVLPDDPHGFDGDNDGIGCESESGYIQSSTPVQPETIPSKNCSGSARCFTGEVTQIIDGDTIMVNGESIRFALTSTPELHEFGGLEAREFLESICPVGSLALVDEDDGQTQGSYGRIVGVIYCNGMNLNEAILDADLGILSSGFCSSSEFSTHAWTQRYGCSYEEPPITTTPSTQTQQTNCDPSYPDFCIPSPPPDLDCKDIPQKRFTVLQPDPHRFDGDKDGIGCES